MVAVTYRIWCRSCLQLKKKEKHINYFWKKNKVEQFFVGIRVFPEKENNCTSRTANVLRKFRLDVRNVLKVSTHLIYLSSDQNLKFLIDRHHMLLLVAVWLLLPLYYLFICLFYTFVLASSSLGLVRLVVKYSFYNIVEVNLLETVLGE